MVEILKSDEFNCEEEVIARQVRVWSLFGNHSQANKVYRLIRWNCILPTAREQIKHRKYSSRNELKGWLAIRRHYKFQK